MRKKTYSYLECSYGIAMLESAVVLIFILPLCIVAIGTWDTLQRSTATSQLVEEALSEIAVEAYLLRNEGGSVTTDLNLTELKHSIDSLSQRVSATLNSQHVISYRVDAVLLVGESFDKPTIIYRSTRNEGSSPPNDPFSDGQIDETNNLNHAYTSLATSTTLIGLAVTLVPNRSFYLSSLNLLGSDGQIAVKKLQRLRGEFKWRL